MAISQPRRRADLEQELSSMNLHAWCFENALARGAFEAASYSDGAPVTAAEQGRWSRTVEEFHTGLIASQAGWSRIDPMNQPTWINPGRHLAIVVSSGDENAGRRTFNRSSNRNPKGSSFGTLVAANGQFGLFDALTFTGEMASINQTWVFLYYAEGGSVYSELSVPIEMRGSSIADWQHQILLPRFDCGSGRFDTDDGNDPSADLSFTIQRR